MSSNKKILINRMVQKSEEAFIFAIEVINKPTSKHRTENFVFNICNAWELTLKAKIVRDLGENKIYLDKQKDRTINFQRCLDLVFTDYANPVKKNIEVIQRLRNKSTHFITPEYDDLYVPVYQANVIYYADFIKKEFDININDNLPSNFLTIASNPKAIDDIRFIERVDPQTFNMFMKEKREIKKLELSEGICVSFEVRMKNVKKDEDFTYRIDPNAELPAQIIEKFMDPNNTHPFRMKDIITKVNNHYGKEVLNQYSFRAIKRYEEIEGENNDFIYVHKQSGSKTYSQKFLNLLLKNIDEQPNYIESAVTKLKEENKKK